MTPKKFPDPVVYRISQLARLFRLSRSTLLYYDRIRLLRPSGRNRANYRVYDAADRRRLEQICRYRDTGMSLESIGEVLDAPPKKATAALKRRLEDLNGDIQGLRAQQKVIVNLLKDPSLLAGTRVLDKRQWMAVLRETGLDDDTMEKWHMAFERQSPEAHQDFLESLGIDARDIAKIRSWSADDRR